MRFARGMFRLWLVLSCAWVAIVAMIAYSTWPSCSAATGPFACSMRPAQTTKDDPNAEYVPEYMKDHADDATYIRPYYPKRDTGSLAMNLAALAFVPPALIFVVGVGLTWALRGFRPQ